MESEHDKVEIISPSLLPQEYEMEYVQNLSDTSFIFLAVNGYHVTGNH